MRSRQFVGFRQMVVLRKNQYLRSASTWILLAIFLFMSVSAPITSYYSKEILTAMADPQLAEILSSSMPEPSWEAAYQSWLKNLGEVCAIAAIVVAALQAGGHARDNSHLFILSRNVGRGAFLGSTMVVQLVGLWVQLLIAASATWLVTVVFFPEASLATALESTAVYAVLIMFFYIATLAAGAVFARLGSALGVGFVLYALSVVGTMWNAPASQWSPTSLGRVAGEIVMGAQQTGVVVTISMTVALCLIIVVASINRFARIQLA